MTGDFICVKNNVKMVSIEHLKRRLIKLINKLGYDLTKINVDRNDFYILDKDVLNPNKILFLAKSNKLPFLSYVPTKHIRGHVLNFNFDENDHPFEVAVKRSIHTDNINTSIKVSLRKIYKEFQPVDACEVLGLEKSEAPKFINEKPWIAVHPWEDRSIEQVKKERPVHTFKENKKNGKNIGIDCGWHLFGPVSEEKLEVEVNRLWKVLNKVVKEGYKAYNNSNNITATVLIDEESGKTKWVVYNGQHRTSVLSALKYEKIPILVNKIVSKKDVDYWTNVANGNYSKESALKVFSKVINS